MTWNWGFCGKRDINLLFLKWYWDPRLSLPVGSDFMKKLHFSSFYLKLLLSSSLHPLVHPKAPANTWIFSWCYLDYYWRIFQLFNWSYRYFDDCNVSMKPTESGSHCPKKLRELFSVVEQYKVPNCFRSFSNAECGGTGGEDLSRPCIQSGNVATNWTLLSANGSTRQNYGSAEGASLSHSSLCRFSPIGAISGSTWSTPSTKEINQEKKRDGVVTPTARWR